MFTHITVGANDIEASRKFYDAALGALGIPPGAFDLGTAARLEGLLLTLIPLTLLLYALWQSFAFFRDSLDQGHPHVVALLDDEVVGWCDVLPVFGEARRHVGTLGIGLVRRARHQGLGAALMRAAIAAAWAKGLTRIELTVRADNPNARALYERMGFAHEGLQRGAFRVDGVSVDSHAMAMRHLAHVVANSSLSTAPS